MPTEIDGDDIEIPRQRAKLRIPHRSVRTERPKEDKRGRAPVPGPAGYQGAAVSVSVGARPRSIEPDIRITQRNGRIRIETERFTARLDAVTFRNEQTFLNYY